MPRSSCYIGLGLARAYALTLDTAKSRKAYQDFLPPRVMVDCSHANSNKDHTKQPVVCREVIAQIAAGDRRIMGVMLESNLVAGAQALVNGKPLIYGQSITDAGVNE